MKVHHIRMMLDRNHSRKNLLKKISHHKIGHQIENLAQESLLREKFDEIREHRRLVKNSDCENLKTYF